MTDWPIPKAQEQLKFLVNIQRLLSEGTFVSSYKFALLHALADLSILKGDDTGAPLELTTRDMARKFIELYWQQARPFQGGATDNGVILKQNTGSRAAVVTKIESAYLLSGGSLYQFQQDETAWRKLVIDVANTVRVMPLWKLQTVGSERIDFLYENIGQGSVIELKPGVAYCFRTFHELLCNLFRSAWVHYLRRYNIQDLGYTTDLQEFLFGHKRSSLYVFKSILKDLQRGECFYCGRPLRSNIDVDHFIPWSRYNSNLAHNFVLAHRGCNSAKSDHFAFEGHLEAWVTRNTGSSLELAQRFSDDGLIHDLDASIRIAHWAYSQTEKANGDVWIRGKEFRRLGSGWQDLMPTIKKEFPKLPEPRVPEI
jgi:hypothetical protein